MGYRLEMSEIKYTACGGKLYGYVDNIKELKSHQWLLEKGYITGNEDWDYWYNPRIILTSGEFKEFIELYKEDFKKYRKLDNPYSEEIQKLIDSGEDILLEWW